jgi:hypothetical protein
LLHNRFELPEVIVPVQIREAQAADYPDARMDCDYLVATDFLPPRGD